MSIGLMGATGTLDIDGLTVELVPVGGAATTNLVVNGDFELGDPAPTYWSVKDAAPGLPGQRLQAALELSHAQSFARAGLALPVDQFDALEVSIAARCSGLRGAGGTKATIFFLDHFGRECRRRARTSASPVLSWSGTSGWQDQTRRGARAAGCGPGRPPDREAGRDRLDPARRRPGHGQPRRPGRRVDPVPRRGRHAGLAAGGGRRRRSRRAAGSTSRSCCPGRPAARAGDGQGRPAGLQPGRPCAVPGRQPDPAVGLPGDRTGRRPGRPARPIGDQPGPAGRPRHGARPGSQPVRRHARRHQGLRPRGAGPARSPDRGPQVAGHLRGAGAPGRPPLPQRGRGRRCGAAPRRRRAGRRLRPHHRQARDGDGAATCSITSTPRRGSRSARTRPWPG